MKCNNGHLYSGVYCKICSEPPSKKKPKAIRKVSLKRQKENPEYIKIRDKFLEENNLCEICGNQSEVLHHKRGRNGSDLTDLKYFMALCNGCHTLVHAHPKESFKNGWMVLRSN